MKSKGTRSETARMESNDSTVAGLSPRQRQILDFIERYAQERGFPPTVREIQGAVGLQSTSSVHAQLKNLEESGYIRREPSRPRALGIAPASSKSKRRSKRSRSTDTGARAESGVSTVDVPLVGRIAAGHPKEPIEAVDEMLPLPWAAFRQVRHNDIEEGRLFLLRVSGDSMTGAGINDGDLALVRRQSTAGSGEVVVAIVDGETTVKRLRVSKSKIALEAENPFYSPIEADPSEVQIAGRVIGLIRPEVR
jgi:repressor LexA